MFVRHIRTPLAALVALAAVPWLAANASAQGRTNGRGQSELTGTLEMVVVDAPDFQTARHEFFLKEDRGHKMYELRFGRLSPGQLMSGMRLSVKGTTVGRRVYVDSLKVESRGAAGVPGAEAGESAPEPDAVTPDAPTLTQRRAVVLMVDLTDAKASTRYTLSQIATSLYTGTKSMDGLYRDASLGQLGFAPDTDGDSRPDVFGPFAVPYAAAANCSYYDWAYAAEAAAERAGIDLTRYQHRVFALPHHSLLTQCTWAGVANVGCGTFCRAWVAESESPLVYAHELGHNLNMAHAGTDPENDGRINAVYGDQSDPMGSSRAWRRFNAAHAHQLGWFAALPGALQAVAASGTYTVAEIGAPGSSTTARALRISKPDSADYYYVSYREPAGYDSGLALTYTQGVSIHRYGGSGYAATSFITSLSDGASFIDAVNGIVITQVLHGAGSATVSITVPAASTTCASALPSATLSPGNKYTRPGGSVSLGTSVRNADGTDCPPTTFSLAYGGTPAGTLAPGTMTLTGGQTGSATLSVSVPTAEGAYTVQVRATDSDGMSPSHVAVTASATVVVDGTAPSVPAGLRAANGRRSIDLSWNASTDARSGVAGYLVLRNGAMLAETAVLAYSDTRVSSGVTYTYSIVAKDKAGNTSAASTPVRVTAGSVKGGGPRK